VTKAFALCGALCLVTALAAPVHAGWLEGATYDMTMSYNRNPIVIASGQALELNGPVGSLIDDDWQAWSTVSTVDNGGIQEVVITIERGNNSPMDPAEAVHILIENLHATAPPVATNSSVPLSVVTLEMELTDAVAPAFTGDRFVPPWTQNWTPADGLTIDIGDVIPVDEGIAGIEVTGIQLTFGVVPEPAGLLLMGAASLCVIRRSRTN
jgi:hypothetical protein